jgi:hypothetical protein
MNYIGKRISYVNKEDELSIVISAYAEKSKTNLMIAWFLAWTLGGIAMIVYLLTVKDTQVKTMVLVWLGFWFYFEYKVWKAITWRKFGKEVIKISQEHFFYKRDNRGQGKVKDYTKDLIQDLGKPASKQNEMISTFLNSYWVIAGESLAFKYLGKEILFGMNLNDKDTAALMKLIREVGKVG